MNTTKFPDLSKHHHKKQFLKSNFSDICRMTDLMAGLEVGSFMKTVMQNDSGDVK